MDVAALGLSVDSDGVLKGGTALDKFATSADKASRSADKTVSSTKALSTQVAQTALVTQRAANSMQMNTGNIAAQFQDIGVTAAMGMNPLLIALQQGTQLSAVFAQSGLKSLIPALRSVISPVSLLTIAVVAGTAAFVQWGASLLQGDEASKKASEAIKSLDQQFNFATISAKQLAEVNALLAEENAKIERTAYGAATATRMMAEANRQAAQAEVTLARARVANLAGFATDPLYADNAGVYIKQIKAIEGQITLTEKAIEGFEKQSRSAGFQMAVMAAGMDDNARKAEVLRSRINQLGEAYKNSTDPAEQARILREAETAQRRLDQIKPDQRASDKASRDAATAARREQREAEKAAQKSAEAIERFNETNLKQLRTLQQTGAQIGVYGRDLAALKNEQDIFNRAQDDGIIVTAKMAAELRNAAGALADLQTANQKRQFMADFARDTDIASFALERQRGELFLTGTALEAYRQTTENLIAARREGVALSDQEVAALQRQNAQMASSQAMVTQQANEWQRIVEMSKNATNSGIQAMQDQLNAARNVVGGFFAQWESGMRNGESAIQSFANSAVNALNRIADRLMDRAIMSFLDSIFPSGSSGGFLGSILGGVTKNANGGVYGAPQQFAKGGAFTNQIVSSPTLFRFAKGGALGEMGEAGPEAIMPLKRGPDGSLGVQMHGPQKIEIVVRGEAGPLFVPIVEEISSNQSVQVTRAGLQAYDEQLPNRFQQIAGDERLRS